MTRDEHFERSVEIHNAIEAVYPKIDAHGARFRGPMRVDPRFPHPPAVTPGTQFDPLVGALSIKAATTKRAVLTLCKQGPHRERVPTRVVDSRRRAPASRGVCNVSQCRP
jgi:hypothetical protein